MPTHPAAMSELSALANAIDRLEERTKMVMRGVAESVELVGLTQEVREAASAIRSLSTASDRVSVPREPAIVRKMRNWPYESIGVADNPSIVNYIDTLKAMLSADKKDGNK